MPLSKAEKESILNRLRAEYDVLLPDSSPFNPENTIAIFERKLNRLKSQATGDRPEVEKENDIRDTEWRIAELRKPNWKNRSRSFAENTKMDVEQIVCDGLNRNVKDQDKRYKRYRESYGISYVELAEVIGVHRKNITRLETPKYSSGIKSIFNVVGDANKTEANQRQGLIKLYNALKFNDKALNRSIYSDANQFANTILNNSTHILANTNQYR